MKNTLNHFVIRFSLGGYAASQEGRSVDKADDALTFRTYQDADDYLDQLNDKFGPFAAYVMDQTEVAR